MYPVNRCKFLDFVLGVEKNAVRGVYGGGKGRGGGANDGLRLPSTPPLHDVYGVYCCGEARSSGTLSRQREFTGGLGVLFPQGEDSGLAVTTLVLFGWFAGARSAKMVYASYWSRVGRGWEA